MAVIGGIWILVLIGGIWILNCACACLCLMLYLCGVFADWLLD